MQHFPSRNRNVSRLLLLVALEVSRPLKLFPCLEGIVLIMFAISHHIMKLKFLANQSRPSSIFVYKMNNWVNSCFDKLTVHYGLLI
jgi:hypothetical protein